MINIANSNKWKCNSNFCSYLLILCECLQRMKKLHRDTIFPDLEIDCLLKCCTN